MKRLALLAATLVLAAGLATLATAQDNSAGAGPPYGSGYGMGYGMGPGMGYGMGYGPGYGMGPGMGYGMGYGHGWGMGGPHYMAILAQLPADKREQLRAFHFSMQRQMISKRAAMEQARLDLEQAMQKFPLDREAAQKAFQTLSKLRGETFELRLTAMQQMQQIVGKDLWEQMQTGPGYGPSNGPGGPGRGPGMMNR
jgi:Spy/CpxP family protein refolding chaperone